MPRQRPIGRLLALTLAILAVLAAGSARATVERVVVADAEEDRLVAVTYDDEKAIRAGQTRGFLLLVERLNATTNLTVFFEVASYDDTAFRVASLPMLEPLGSEPVTLEFRLHANETAAPRRYPVSLAATVVNLNATSNATVLTRHEFPMNVTLSPLPTPFGETGSTLSVGEWTAVASMGAVVTLLAIGRRVRSARRGG